MSEQSKETKLNNDAAATQLDLMTNNKTVKKVSYKDMDDKEHELEAIFKDPGDYYMMMAIDMIQNADDTSDFVSLYSLIMDKVLLSPRFTFKFQNEQLKKELKSVREHTITVTNKENKDIRLVIKLPNYEEMVKILYVSVRPSSAANMVGLINELQDNVLYDTSNQKISTDFWEYGKPGNGAMQSVVNETLSYINQVMNRDGFISVMNEGITFLTKR